MSCELTFPDVQTPEAYWELEGFLTVNHVLTAIWLGIFLVCLILSWIDVAYELTGFVDMLTTTLIPLILVVVGLWSMPHIVQWFRERDASPSETEPFANSEQAKSS